MAMTCWKILGIEQTNDVKAVKKAYAIKLREINPDEQPQEFQKLKQAFDLAVKLAKMGVAEEIAEEEETADRQQAETGANEEKDSETEKEAEVKNEQETEEKAGNEEEAWAEEKSESKPDYSSQHSIEEWHRQKEMERDYQGFEKAVKFTDKVTGLLLSREYFDDFDSWNEILEESSSWSIQEFMNYSRAVQNILVERFFYLSKPIIQLLFSVFQLDTLEEDYQSSEMVDQEFTRRKYQIMNAPDFDFSMWRKISPENRAEYFSCRYEYYFLLNQEERQPLRLKELQKKVSAIYDEDGDFRLIQALNEVLEVYGNLDDQKAKDKCLAFLVEALPLGYRNQQLAVFLQTYCKVWQEKKLEEDTQKLLFEKASAVPPVWQHYLLGLISLRCSQNDAALYHFEYLSQHQLLLLHKERNQLRRLLSFEGRKRLTQLEKAKYVVNKGGGKPQKELSKTAARVYGFLAVVIIILAAYFFIRDNMMPNTASVQNINPNVIANNFSSEMAERRSVDRMIDENASSAERFVYHFLINDDQEARQQFIDDYALGDAAALLQERIGVEAIYPEAERTDFGFVSDYTETDGRCELVSHSYEAILIIKQDTDRKITDIYGTDWHDPGTEKFTALVGDIQVRPNYSLSFLIWDYLPSDDREQTLETYSHYVRDDLMKLMKEKAGESANEKYSEATWQASELDGQAYFIINDAEDELGMIVQFDTYGRLAHIYLDGWEEMDQKKVDKIVENSEEKRTEIYAFALQKQGTE